MPKVEEKACGGGEDTEVPIKTVGIVGWGGTEVSLKCEEKELGAAWKTFTYDLYLLSTSFYFPFPVLHVLLPFLLIQMRTTGIYTDYWGGQGEQGI